MDKQLFLDGKRIYLNPADLIQAGGEGIVFTYGDQQAIKVYHNPNQMHQHKLEHLIKQIDKQQLPSTVYAPCQLVYNDQDQVAGFTMTRMPIYMRPFKKLTNPNFCRKHHITVPDVVTYLLQLHDTLTQLHQQGLVVGDLNDHNIFFALDQEAAETGWIDVDSYQIGRFPCPVALQTFLDPNLYSVNDLSQKPYFSPETDWYAYFVLLVNSLLHVHPYGGTHHTHKSLLSRAEHQITILNGAVTYPKQARPLDTLSEDLLHHVQLVFGKGERSPFPRELLTEYAHALMQCPDCGHHYPQHRSRCPRCHQTTPLQPPVTQRGQIRFRELLRTNGYIEAYWIKPDHNFGSHNRYHIVVREGKLYKLIYAGINGIIEEMPLFSGQPGYRFGFFDQHLVVNPPGRSQLLILDVGGLEPTKLTVVETDLFDSEAIFATTPGRLYRIANGYILEGAIQEGQLVEEVVATAYQHQTQLWGSRQNNTLVAIHRIFGDYQLVIRQPTGRTEEFTIPLKAGESIKEWAVSFNLNGRDTTFFAQIMHHGQLRHRRFTPTLRNSLTTAEAPPFIQPPVTINDSVLSPTNHGILKQKGHLQVVLSDAADYVSHSDTLHAHPRGLVIQQAQRLYLAES